MNIKKIEDVEQKILDETFDVNPEETHQIGNQVTKLITEYFKNIDNTKQQKI